ncbi:MAG: cytochrome c oxidase subunit II [Candidatus Eisenbacteria bacterium]|uniref:Cytochrome c oxidase subunit 2 n=1 Tax=Eiseniibacteriota bacterium TaxID=2212470 RepID=A0A937X7M7_UNCEI|nr:cytochrome c oxidase subunit II [Candidatus Eisenbacteria bacterium]
MYGPVTSYPASVDATFYFIVAVSLFFLLLVTTLMIVFAVRYRRSRRPRAEQIEGHTLLEIAWTIIPLLLVLAMFHFGFEGFRALRSVPEGAMTVKVTGRMWDWSFRYENGREAAKLYVPVDRAIKLSMTSVDVLHSFYIPAFRVKEDVVPGRETYLWFRPQTTGPADIYCAEYCGQRHAYMMSEVVVLEAEEFEAWLAAGGEEGEKEGVPALLARHACLDCHSLDGSPGVGPTLRGLYGRQRALIVAGREETRVADEAYLRRAILEPDAEYVRDHERNMPAPVGLSEEDLERIIAYIRALE